MALNRKRQWTILAALLLVYALLTLCTYLFLPLEDLIPPTQAIPASTTDIPRWLLAFGSAGIVFVLYGFLGLAGYWFAHKLGLPTIFREDAGWRAWFLTPLLLGFGLGITLVIVDDLFAATTASEGFPHPAFPLSLIASATAGIGEEILFRAFVMGLWAFLFNVLLGRWGSTRAALWTANVVAALAFSAGHLPSAMILLDVANPADIPVTVLVEGLILNSLVGLVAGERYMRDGLVAAVGVHFWTDIVWHVIWPAVG